MSTFTVSSTTLSGSRSSGSPADRRTQSRAWSPACTTALDFNHTANHVEDPAAESSELSTTSSVWGARRPQTREQRQALVFGTSSDGESPDGRRGCPRYVIRWLNDTVTRVPMLTLPDAPDPDSAAEVPSGDVWAVLVPLWTDVENAVPGDVVLDASESTTGVTWRAAFRHQTTLPASALGETLGWLTESGCELFDLALAGNVPAWRTGSPLESEFDPRLAADLWIQEAIGRALKAVRLDDEDDEDWFDDEQDESSAIASPTVEPFGRLSSTSLLLLKPRFVSSSRAQYQLAATSALHGDEECVLEPADQTTRFAARLWLDIGADELRFCPTDVPDKLVGRKAKFIVTLKFRDPLTAHGVVEAGRVVVFSSQQAVAESDVVSVEVLAQ